MILRESIDYMFAPDIDTVTQIKIYFVEYGSLIVFCTFVLKAVWKESRTAWDLVSGKKRRRNTGKGAPNRKSEPNSTGSGVHHCRRPASRSEHTSSDGRTGRVHHPILKVVFGWFFLCNFRIDSGGLVQHFCSC